MFFRLWKASTLTAASGSIFTLVRKPLLPCRHPSPSSQKRPLFNSSVMSSQLHTEAWVTGPNSTQFYSRTYTPPAPTPTKAVVVFIHGFAEHIGRYTHFHPLLAARGVAAFAFDQRGFGLTAQDTTGKKSKTSAYGKTSWKDQMGDIDWALKHVKQAFADTPIFLMGHSMGGGEVLGFSTQGDKGASTSSLQLLSGTIATSPCIHQTTPASKVARWIGGKVAAVLPSSLIPAPVNEKDLSHDSEVNNAYLKDPLVKLSGSLRGISDMLSYGERLLVDGYPKWPKNLPLLIVHGTGDMVTSHKASQLFHDKISAISKKISLFEGGFHELQNEPDGVKERLADEIIAFIEAHLPQSPPSIVAETEGSATAATDITAEPAPTGETAETEPTSSSPPKAKM